MDEKQKRQNLIDLLNALGVTEPAKLATDRMVKKALRRLDPPNFVALRSELQAFAREELGYSPEQTPAVAGAAEIENPETAETIPTETAQFTENVAPDGEPPEGAPATKVKKGKKAAPKAKGGKAPKAPKAPKAAKAPKAEKSAKASKATKVAKGKKEPAAKTERGPRGPRRGNGQAMELIRNAFTAAKARDRYELIDLVVKGSGATEGSVRSYLARAKQRDRPDNNPFPFALNEVKGDDGKKILKRVPK